MNTHTHPANPTHPTNNASNIDIQVFIDRRQHLFNILKEGIAIIPNTSTIIRNNDTQYSYRFDSNFYYLTGFNEPNAVLVLDINKRKSILFCQEKNEQHEIWDGYRYGSALAKNVFAMNETYRIEEFACKIASFLENSQSLHYTIGYMPCYDNIIITALNNTRRLIRQGMQYPTTITDINHHIANMRLLKDAYDIKRITTACNISVNAHLQAMRKVKSCNYEYELEAILLQEFYAHGSRYPAYTSIVGGGKNACVLHYVSNDAKLNSGELVLIDAGCEYMGYASDITRTYPVNGRFTKAQQKIYEIVLAANKAAIAEVRLGNEWNKPADTAVNVITQGLIDLGILQGEVKENIEAGHYKQFYMHAIGHWLGLDVHDVGSYKVNGTWRKYEASMCTTIEPGIYIRPHANVKEEYWNIGVRIEDDILLTTNGAVNLTQGVPKEVTELEQVISGH